jgi:hypothetical protein
MPPRARPTRPSEVSPPGYTDPPTYDVEEFCRAHNISVSFFFKLQARNEGPRTMLVGTRRIVTGEAARDWRIAREAAARASRSRR